MRQDDLQQMRSLRLFDGMAESHVESMLRVSFLQRFPAHVELVREGEPADFLHMIIDGQVECIQAITSVKQLSAFLDQAKASQWQFFLTGSISNRRARFRLPASS
jgi:CRP-like cAMP-binding protein